MLSVHRPIDLPPFVYRLARSRAKRLCRLQIPAHDLQDIEQHLLLEVCSRWEKFDCKRGSLHGFAARVINNAAADLATRHASHRRTGIQIFSLDQEVADQDGNVVPWVDILSADCGLWTTHQSDWSAAADMQIDLARAMVRLSVSLRDICRCLGRQTVAQIARDRDGSRSSIYRQIAEIRMSFLEAGLQTYLHIARHIQKRPGR